MQSDATSPGPAPLWPRALIAIVLVAFCIEFVLPTAAWSQGPSSASSVQTIDTLPPMQKADTIATPPFYKRWWFWTLVAVVVVGGIAVAAAGGGGGGNGGGAAPTGGAVVTGPGLP
jgi:hypothetical protein